MQNNQNQKKIGIVGVGMVGGALRKYFEKQGIRPLLFDKSKNFGSLKEVNMADIIFICVPTPFNKEKQSFDLSYIEESCNNISDNKTIIIKSTVPPGTTRKLQEKYPQHKFLFNPEFLTEITAEQDMNYPDRQIIGYTEQSYPIAKDIIQMLPLAPFERIIPSAEAEMVKYFGNNWFAVKVAFANQMYDLCQKMGINYDLVMESAAADKRIGRTHLEVRHRGYRGYGGKCLSGEEIIYEVTDNGLKVIPIKDFQGKRVLSMKDGRLIVDEVLAKSQREIKKTIKFYFSKGRTLETSPDHLMTVFDRKKGLTQKQARYIELSDKAPVIIGQIPLIGQDIILNFFDNFNNKEEIFTEEIDKNYASTLKPYLSFHQYKGFKRERSISLPAQALVRAQISLAGLKIKTGKTGSWVPSSFQLNEDFARLIGYYLSEGCSSGGRIFFSFGYHEEELINDLILILDKFNIKFSKEIGYWEGHKSSLTIKVSSKILSDYFRKFGENSYLKSIPDFMFSTSQEIKDELLSGLFRGDGSIGRSNMGNYYTVSYATVSRNLAEGIDLLLREKGILTSRKKWLGKKSKALCYGLNISESDGVRKILPLFSVNIRKKIKISKRDIKSPAYLKINENIVLLDIRKREESNGSKVVYALETKSHYYLTSGGILTHNCLPKDIRALIKFAEEQGIDLKLHKTTEEINNQLMKEQNIDDPETFSIRE